MLEIGVQVRCAMTIDAIIADAMTHAATLFDAKVEDAVREHEAVIRRDIAATGEEDQDPLDRPPDPDSDWQRCTVEETVEAYRRLLAIWKTVELWKLHAKIVRFVVDRLQP